ncbi:hypothetical protein ACWDE9_23995 [Streptomyces olivaceoviridis]
MHESRQSPSGAGAVLPRKVTAPPALCGFLLLLALVFTVSYTVGATAGPVAPGMHGTGTSRSGGGGDDGGAGGMDDMGDMHGGSR